MTAFNLVCPKCKGKTITESNVISGSAPPETVYSCSNLACGAYYGDWQAYQAAGGNPSASTNQANQRAAQQAIARANIARAAQTRSAAGTGKDLPLEITVGELIGWRIWQWKDDFLWSFSTDRIWMPDTPMVGDFKAGTLYYGVEPGIWSFKNSEDAVKKMIASPSIPPYITGSILMWGTVIEHEKGYRAEYANIRSLDYCNHKIADLDYIRHKYNLTPPSDASPTHL